MSSKDNSYSALTKRLRSKYNAAFYQNNNSGQVNIFSSGVGNINNGWINSLVTGRKDVINTSDLGERNVDDSCVCGAAPAPAPAPAPIEPESILLMAIGSAYAVTRQFGIFKANTVGELTKEYLQRYTTDISFIPYILEVKDTNAYIVGQTDLTTSVVHVINKATGETVINTPLTFPDSFVTGVTEIVSGLDTYVYINYVTIDATDPENPTTTSYVDVYNINDFSTVVNHLNLDNQFERFTIVLSQVVSSSDAYYIFTYNYPNVLDGDISYDFSVLRFINPDLTGLSESSQLNSGNSINLQNLLLNLQSIAIFRPAVYTDGSETEWIAVPQIREASNGGFQAYRVSYEGGIFTSNNYIIDPSITSASLVPVSSLAPFGSYLVCTAGSEVTGNKIYSIPRNFGFTIVTPSTPSFINASDYVFTSDGTSIYRWYKDPIGQYFIQRYDNPTSLTVPSATSAFPYPNVPVINPPNIMFDISVTKLFANVSPGSISEIDKTTLALTENDINVI